MNFLKFLPFSSPWIIRNHLGKVKTVLDVGCGDGSLMLKVNADRKYMVMGIDLYIPYLRKARTSGVYKKIKRMDIRGINFKSRSFDVVLASQVIEHLKKRDALKLLILMEKSAKKRVIICTTNGYFKYDPFEVRDDNSLQKHLSGWSIEDFRRRGYKVYGQGLGLIYKPSGLLYRFRKLKNIFVVVSLLFAPITYFFPNTSAYLVAVKEF